MIPIAFVGLIVNVVGAMYFHQHIQPRSGKSVVGDVFVTIAGAGAGAGAVDADVAAGARAGAVVDVCWCYES